METKIDWEQKASVVLDIIAEKLGVGVDHFWPLFVREQVVEGCVGLVIVFLILVGWISCIGLYLKFRKSMDDVFIMVPIFFSIVCLIIVPSIVLKRNIFGKIINPEYHALKEVMEMVK